jgi:hypothetical protein
LAPIELSTDLAFEAASSREENKGGFQQRKQGPDAAVYALYDLARNKVTKEV